MPLPALLLAPMAIGALIIPIWLGMLLLLPVIGIPLLLIASLWKYIIILLAFGTGALVAGSLSQRRLIKEQWAGIFILFSVVAGFLIAFTDLFKGIVGSSVEAAGLTPTLAVAIPHAEAAYSATAWLAVTVAIVIVAYAASAVLGSKHHKKGGKVQSSQVAMSRQLSTFGFLLLVFTVVGVSIAAVAGLGTHTACSDGSRNCDSSNKAQLYNINFPAKVCNGLTKPEIHEEQVEIEPAGFRGFNNVKVTVSITSSDGRYKEQATQVIGRLGYGSAWSVLSGHVWECKPYSIRMNAVGSPSGGSREYSYTIKSTSDGGYSDTKNGVFTLK